MKALLLNLEYEIKLLNLRLKYSKTIWETIGLIIQISITIAKFQNIAIQQIRASKLDKFAVIGTTECKECIITKGGKKVVLTAVNRESNGTN